MYSQCIRRLSVAVLLIVLLGPAPASAGEVLVAVASNFSSTMQRLAERFEEHGGHTVTLAHGSTGRHYAQIRNGAPYDVFLAADERRPRLLEEDERAVAGSRFTYAVGRLVLWSPREAYVNGSGQVLSNGDFRFLAIANPRLAPYGRAADEVLRERGIRERLEGRIIQGENISQAFQFVRSGNAELGFVALSQILDRQGEIPGSYWRVPPELYTPVRQQAVLIRDREPARQFMEFMRSETARSIIRNAGYRLPAEDGSQ